MQQTKNKEEFIKVVLPYAEKSAKQIGVPTIWVLQHWGHETGWGKNSDTKINNLAGVGHFDNASSGYKFNSLDDFADYYANMIKKDRYYKGVKKAKSMNDYAQSLKNGGYATDPNYAYKTIWSSESLNSTQKYMSKYSGTYKYENGKRYIKVGKEWMEDATGGVQTQIVNNDEDFNNNNNHHDFGDEISSSEWDEMNWQEKLSFYFDNAFGTMKLGFFTILIFIVVLFLLYQTFITNTILEKPVSTVNKGVKTIIKKSRKGVKKSA